MSEIAETTQPGELRNYDPAHQRDGEYGADAEFARRLLRLALVLACSLMVWGSLLAVLWTILT